MWYYVLTLLKRAITEMDSTIEVSLGAIPPEHLDVGSNGNVLLIRGDEDMAEAKDTKMLDVTIYLEAWVREDSPNLENGYKLLTKLEESIDKALTVVRQAVTSLDEQYCVLNDRYQLMDIVVERKVGDLDSIRPLVGSQYTIRCKLYLLVDDIDIY
ncbi:hypothetical protein [Veillonella montpellierensis]|uniref:hypothetical protein n=1 Tax=Veillonella montpellierensis TaxID=187328 RepID=UPI0023FA009F|nr:hypothetical protein [Veillonella montpellierensis]